MTPEGLPTFIDFAVSLMDRAQSIMLEAVDGLSDQQLFDQPGPQSNTVGWLMWHLSRMKDLQSASVTSDVDVWQTEGWAQRFDLPQEANGYQDTPDAAAAFRADRNLLIGYAAAAHEAAVRRMRDATTEQLLGEVASPLSGIHRVAWMSIQINATDYTHHTGQIAYLRGLMTAPGWMSHWSQHAQQEAEKRGRGA